jgi:hypothetical protein
MPRRRVWEHMSRGAPAEAGLLDEVIRSRLADGGRDGTRRRSRVFRLDRPGPMT